MDNSEIEVARNLNPELASISEYELTKLLPTCQRCRRLRRRCDTSLPACSLCAKGKADCTFQDHALGQTLPRSYVESLLKRLARLRTVHATIAQNTQERQQPSIFSHPIRQGQSRDSFDFNRPVRRPQTSFDKHFDIEHANPTCWQFVGSSSAYALAVEVLVNAQSHVGSLTHPDKYDVPQFKFNIDVPESLDRQLRPTPDRQEVQELATLYMSTSNILNGYANENTLNEEMDVYLQHQPEPELKNLTGPAAYQFFRIAMICAIACANRCRHRAEDSEKAFAYYVEAAQLAEEVTSNVSLDSLQALILLIQYSLFYPRRGDVWKLLDYACRLSVELGIHREVTPDQQIETVTEDLELQRSRRALFWGLYSFERTFGQHLGRPSDLPEQIITTEYPVPLNHDFERDGEKAQLMLVSHYYRLIYIRSEIFRALYMPAVAPELSHSWYADRLNDFVGWKAEFEAFIVPPLPPGMGALQIEMGFPTSIIFLFQPLLLRALAATKRSVEDETPQTLDSTNLAIPYESYNASVETILFYERVLTSGEGTAEGDYPVTILSAHYIHQAAFTIMAYLLLTIDGRLPVIQFYQYSAQASSRPQIDFTNIANICLMCRRLLEVLAERWAGMVGILDLYIGLQNKVLPLFERVKTG